MDKTNPKTEPARVFVIYNDERFSSIASKTLTIPILVKSGIVLINNFEFDNVTISINQVVYGFNYCDSYFKDIDAEPDLIRCINEETKECVLTIYKPKRNHIDDVKTLGFQLKRTKAGTFKFSEIDKIVERELTSLFGKIKSKTNADKTILTSIIFNTK